MLRTKWFVVAPVVLLLGGLGGRALWSPTITRGADGRIMADGVIACEEKVGHHLYAPTWLPYDGRVGALGVRVGAKRVLQDVTDNQDRTLCILAQEKRTADRDVYHRRIFRDRSDSTAALGERTGYFVRGTSGERRLFWEEKDVALVLSSNILTDQELAEIAVKVR